MHIIILSETQYRNYSAVHSKRNYKQTVEYANMMKNYGYDKMFLGLVDDSNNVISATVILEKKLFGKYNYGYAPNGFLNVWQSNPNDSASARETQLLKA